MQYSENSQIIQKERTKDFTTETEKQITNDQDVEDTFSKNNSVFLKGTILTDPVFSHDAHEERMFEILISVGRLSGMFDSIPVTIPEALVNKNENDIKIGKTIAIKGQFRSYNKIVGDRSKLMLTVFVRQIIDPSEPVNMDEHDNPNIIELTGYVCKAPIYRTTPFNREITDLLIAVNRAYNKSDYIPAIAWGKNARQAKNMLIGDKIFISGRIQSREYQKRLIDGTIETRTAYEISINKLSSDKES